MKQVEGNEEYHGVIDDPSSASGILFQGLIFVIKQGRGKEAVRRWDGERQTEERRRLREAYCVTPLSFFLSPPPSCGSSKQPSPGQLRGCCLTSQAENGPCPLLPCSISFPSCLSFVMDTACNKKSQHIYGVADLACTQVLLSAGHKTALLLFNNSPTDTAAG